MERVRDMRESNHGRYTEILDEKEAIQTSAYAFLFLVAHTLTQTSKENLCVIHFYHRDFQRCKIMDKHLEARSQPLVPQFPLITLLRPWHPSTFPRASSAFAWTTCPGS